MNTAPPSAKRICMITHSYYESDNRVMRYAESLAKRGDAVDVVALRRSCDLPTVETISGVSVFRIQDRFGKREQSRSSFLWPLLQFLIASSRWLVRSHRNLRYDLVHVHNIPDFLVFAAWYPKLLGAKIILDIHDIVPEFFASKFAVSERSLMVRALKFVEWLSASFADRIILANHLWLDKYSDRSAPKQKCVVFVNHVDAQIFRPMAQPVKHADGVNNRRAIILFPGGLQWHQGLDVAIRGFEKLHRRLTQAEFHIYGDGIMKPELVKLTQNLGLNGSVRFFDPLRLQQIAGVMAQADLGVVPKRADSFGNEAYSTKIMEFMSVGVPVVVSETKIDRFYFDDSVVRFFESGNPDALADAMIEVLENAELRRNLVSRSAEYVARNSWEVRKRDYLELVDSLCNRK